MRIEEDYKLDFDNVLIRPKRSTLSSRREVSIERTFSFRHTRQSWEGVPIIASNMDGVGTFSMASVLQQHKMMTVIRKYYPVEAWVDAVKRLSLDPNYLAVCTGSSAIYNSEAKDYKKVQQVLELFPGIRWICIDIANGYQETFVDFVRKVRADYPHHIVIAGNVCSPEMTEELIISGADVVKVGIGPGSVCTTRIKAGVGYPQLSAIIECSDAAHGLGGHIIGDGGCAAPGDLAKAFGGGADLVMLGGMLAFHEECEETIDDDGMITFYGMSSGAAMTRHGASRRGYRASEGRIVKHPCRGPVEDTLIEIQGGLRSACSYAGARRLKDLPKCTTFIKVHSTHNRTYESIALDDRFLQGSQKSLAQTSTSTAPALISPEKKETVASKV